MTKDIFAKNPEKYVPALAEALKKIPEFKAPEWVAFVKSGVAKQRPMVDYDFWYVRTASILRQLYINGVVGVGKLRVRYGSKKDRGGRPDKFRKAGGKIIRTILQQAESAGLVEKVNRSQFGRRLTQKGREFLDAIEVENENMKDFDSLTYEPKVIEQEIETVEELNEESEDGEQESEE